MAVVDAAWSGILAVIADDHDQRSSYGRGGAALPKSARVGRRIGDLGVVRSMGPALERVALGVSTFQGSSGHSSEQRWSNGRIVGRMRIVR